MKTARKYSSEIVKEALIEALSDGTYDNTAKLMLEEYAEQAAIEFTNWYRNTAFKKTMNKPTTLLYEQFMIERSRRTQNNKCVIPDVSVSLPKSSVFHSDCIDCELYKEHIKVSRLPI